MKTLFTLITLTFFSLSAMAEAHVVLECGPYKLIQERSQVNVGGIIDHTVEYYTLLTGTGVSIEMDFFRTENFITLASIKNNEALAYFYLIYIKHDNMQLSIGKKVQQDKDVTIISDSHSFTCEGVWQ